MEWEVVQIESMGQREKETINIRENGTIIISGTAIENLCKESKNEEITKYQTADIYTNGTEYAIKIHENGKLKLQYATKKEQKARKINCKEFTDRIEKKGRRKVKRYEENMIVFE